MDRPLQEQLYEQFERVAKALASRRRLELLDTLAQGERSVEDLAIATGMTVTNASQHLQILRRARLVESRRAGTYVFCRLADESVFKAWQAMRELARTRLTEVELITRDFVGGRRALEPVRMGELLERMRAEDVIVLDVRPKNEYESGHIAGARSIPLDELEARLSEIPVDAEIVAYCRGPYCVLADDAVERLRRHHRLARRLDLGFPDWKAEGLPIEMERSLN
jgi:rhodanese-related sulfurtransferase/DNA-binding MarR family transcriptional regulator